MGAIVVARSLRHHGTTRSVVVLITPNVSEQSRWVMHFLLNQKEIYHPNLLESLYITRLSLQNVFDEVIVVDLMDSGDDPHLSVLGRPELGITFTKIHCWSLTQYTKCVFLDADTLVSQHSVTFFHYKDNFTRWLALKTVFLTGWQVEDYQITDNINCWQIVRNLCQTESWPLKINFSLRPLLTFQKTSPCQGV